MVDSRCAGSSHPLWGIAALLALLAPLPATGGEDACAAARAAQEAGEELRTPEALHQDPDVQTIEQTEAIRLHELTSSSQLVCGRFRGVDHRYPHCSGTGIDAQEFARADRMYSMRPPIDDHGTSSGSASPMTKPVA